MAAWKAVDIYVRGRSNEEKGKPCLDRTFSIIEKQIAYIALATGLDSSRFSHIGAEIVIREAHQFMRKRFDELFKEEEKFIRALILQHLIERLTITARRLQVRIDDLSSTLLFVAVKAGKIIAGHIGDGVIGCLQDGCVVTMSYPQGMQYAGNLFYVTSLDARARFNVIRCEIEDGQGYILMSGGSAENLFDFRTSTFSQSTIRMLDSFKHYSSSKIEKALRKNLKEVLTRKTNRDCSICMLRRVESFADHFRVSPSQSRLPFYN